MSNFQVALNSSGYDENDRPLPPQTYMASAARFELGSPPVANANAGPNNDGAVGVGLNTARRRGGGGGGICFYDEENNLVGYFPNFLYVIKLPS